jgi:hypothetical protein
MKTFAALFLSGTIVAHAQVGAYNIAKGQARRANEANNAEQQRIENATRDPVRPNTPGQPAPPPADPIREATLKNIGDLQSDFTALNNVTGAETPAAQKAALLNDLTAAALGKKAASASVKTLADHLIAVTSGKKNSAPSVLARNVHALFNGSHLTAAQTATLLDGVKKNLLAAGASETDAGNVVDDLKGIADETK